MPVARPSQPWTVNTSSTQYTGLVGYWPGNDNGSGLVQDYIGTKHLQYEQGSDGTNLSLNIQTMPTIGGDAPLVGDDGSVHPSLSYTSANIIGTSDEFTISLWHVNTNDAGLQRTVFIQGYESNATWAIKIDRNAGNPGAYFGSVVTTSAGAQAIEVTGSSTYANDALVLVTLVWKPGQYLRLFTNGAQDGNTATATTTLRTASNGFAFPGRRDQSGNYTSPGYYADMRAYTRAFSNAEVAELYAESTRWDLLGSGGGGSTPTRNRVIFVL